MDNLSDRHLAFLKNEMETVLADDDRPGSDHLDAHDILSEVTEELRTREEQLLA